MTFKFFLEDENFIPNSFILMLEHERVHGMTLTDLYSAVSQSSNMLDNGAKSKDYYQKMIDQYVGDYDYKRSCIYHDIRMKYGALTKKDLITFALIVDRISGVRFMKFMERNLGAIYRYLEENDASSYFSIINIAHVGDQKNVKHS